MNIPEEYDWSESLDCAVTLCDNEGTVLYQNCLLYTSPSPRDTR